MKRSPILGYNHNFKHRGLVFHVQTEDSGVDNPHIFTHLFHGGVILSSRRLDYDSEAAEDVVKSLMQAQHKAALKDLKNGTFDDKIDAYFGDRAELQPRQTSPIPEIAPDDNTDRMPTFQTPPPDADLDLELEAEPPSESELAAPSLPSFDAAPESPPAPPPQPASPSRTTQSLPPPSKSRPAPPPIESLPPVPPLAAKGDPMVTFRPSSRTTNLGRKPERPAVTAADVSAAFQALEDEGRATPPPIPGAARGAVPSEVRREGSVGSYSQVRRRTSAPPPRPTEPPAPASSKPAKAPPRGTPPVVVSRPAVIIGAPPKVVGGSNKTPPPRRAARDEGSIFGQDLISEKSLDEVILAYLSEDGPEDD